MLFACVSVCVQSSDGTGDKMRGGSDIPSAPTALLRF